jgi:ABC-type antimicrobial peptide transport system permease subunit
MVVRTRTDAAAAVLPTLALMREMDPDILIYSSSTMADFLSTQLLPARLGAFALLLFAGLALGLAVIGLYGVVSYAVASRSREVGIRMSLGADVRSVVRMLMGDGLRLAAIGAAAGLVLAFVLSQGLRSLLFGVPALDPVTFLGVPAVLLAAALVAAWLPARRAGRVQPVRALRQE